ncbi:alpha/beta fold hydrolase [Notoacmeibacter sp. MSK16QG-6]|uniref:alpha/beta fold hydrolase n=1 Tax=Notoacmeibacter sp. MSK16QG-6 TaxID=2957982 RepID=UPI00209D83D5|nr:alpha/beta fold hydrolase [Notoacmeibacter sp. MSK16QG-6]MCP1197868.1 alpha/beta fold hydrolase [Notoacmeibacter sp. MSK16QG-6]
MTSFIHDGLPIAFQDEGPRDGDPVLLIHGFASNRRINWVETGWTKTLDAAGYRVIALDNRGHGDSEKLYDPKAYTPALMAADAVALLDHLKIPKAHIMGYSMGGRIAAFLARDHGERVATLTLGGIGMALIEGSGDWKPVADALLTDEPDTITDPTGLEFRTFADRTGADRKALAACIASNRVLLSAEDMAQIDRPTLVAVGTKDTIAGSPKELAALMPKAVAFDIERRSHLIATGDKTFKARLLAFLEEYPL